MPEELEPNRTRLRLVTIGGPLLFLAGLVVVHFVAHPRIALAWRAGLVGALLLSGGAIVLFSRFVFRHVELQEEALLRRTQELAEANQAMAVVKERQRIARELHDSVAQLLGYLHLQLAAAEQRMASGDVTAVAERLPELRRVAREAYAESREAIFGLRGMASRSLGLVPNLGEFLQDWSRQTGVAVDFKVGVTDNLAVAPVVEVQLIGIIQEALANVRKHARAHRVSVELDGAGRSARLSIADNGNGFDAVTLETRPERSFGIEMMRERAEAVDAKLLVTSAPGNGTTVEVQFPLLLPGASA